jgi:hypothetical protein
MLASMQMRAPRCMYIAPSRTLKNEPMTLISNSWRNSATGVSKNGRVLMMPAAVTSASRPPQAVPACSNARTTDGSSATSSSIAMPSEPGGARAPERLQARRGGGADAAGRARHRYTQPLRRRGRARGNTAHRKLLLVASGVRRLVAFRARREQLKKVGV